MSKYTTEVRYICETNTTEPVDGNGFNYVNEIINKSHSNIFNFEYPIFDENYRATLETKILRHYYTREICEETVGLWKLRLCDRLNLIMPYYNKMYESELLKFNPFYDVDITRSHGKSNTGTQSGEGVESDVNTSVENISTNNANSNSKTKTTETDSNVQNIKANNESVTGASEQNSSSATSDNSKSTGSSNRVDKYADTPQGSVLNIDDGYLTNVRKIDDSKEDTTTSTSGSVGSAKGSTNESRSGNESEINSGKVASVESDNGVNTNVGNEEKELKENKSRVNANTTKISNIEDYIEFVRGKQGTVSYSKLLKEFRETFLNIDMMIIEELSDLFFGLWE